MASTTKANVKAQSSAELLSYIINENPVLRENIDLPVQGQSIAPIGKIIINNERYKNAFLNTVNLIGLTVIKRNHWENPWSWFTVRGTLNYGQQVREIINDLANVYDYNENFPNKDRFLETVVPNIYQYLHEVNFQKFYQTTTSDAQMAMAFENDDLFSLIDTIISSLYESYSYDSYITDKYMLCRRILDGTMSTSYIANFNTLSTREIVAKMKAVSNKMTFRSPNYNPAGIRRATPFEEQITIVNTDFDASITTEVLATSYFRNDAEMKTNLALIDSFGEHDTARLTELLGTAYVPFTSDELTALSAIPAVTISKEWFMDYLYTFDNQSNTMKSTEFYNPTTLENNHFLHVWRIFSTSPFENGVVFTQTAPSVTSVSVTPATATVSAGLSLQLTANVVTAGFANKSVLWSVNTEGCTIDSNGLLKVGNNVASATKITVTATSVFDSTKSGTAEITVA